MTKQGRALLLFEGAEPTRDLERALAWATLLDCELQVVQIAATGAPRGPGVRHINLLEGLRAAESAVQLDRIATSRLADALGIEREADNSWAQLGDFVKRGAAQAAEAGADLILMGPRKGGLGDKATALASASRLPVLVAREAMSEESIVAATDLEDVAYPVLHAATELGRRLDAPVIALHNCEPVCAFSATDSASPSATESGKALAELKRRRLERVVQNLPGHATPVLANQADPVNGILQEAHARGVDLIVVGTQRRSRIERSSVPVRVIDRARCSVLVLPLDAVGPARPRFRWA